MYLNTRVTIRNSNITYGCNKKPRLIHVLPPYEHIETVEKSKIIEYKTIDKKV